VLHFLRFLYGEPDGWRIVFNLFRYVTFRSAGAAVTAFIFVLFVGPSWLARLRAMKMLERTQKGDSAKLDEMHSSKATTPTMGGLLILAGAVGSALLWGKLVDWAGPKRGWYANWYLVGAILTYAALAALGFVDDYRKLKLGKGLSMRSKLAAQAVIGVGVAAWLMYLGNPDVSTKLALPFTKYLPDLGVFFLVWALLVIMGSSNAVNITDGLDGLAAGCTFATAMTYGIIAYVASHAKLAAYLYLPFVPGGEELAVFCAACAGATLGFLWFNAHPAEVFMGDTGALPLGGAIGYCALAVKQEILLVLVGGVFVMEAMSVLIQIASFKLFGRRVFRIAPLHHHYQFAGWAESKIVVRFWIMAAVFALLALATLKVR